jgi:hypothetical protein
MKIRLTLTALILAACATIAIAQDFKPPADDKTLAPAQDGRFHLTAATVDFTSAAGAGTAHLLFKIDSTTGRTWILDTSTNGVSWHEIQTH